MDRRELIENQQEIKLDSQILHVIYLIEDHQTQWTAPDLCRDAASNRVCSHMQATTGRNKHTNMTMFLYLSINSVVFRSKNKKQIEKCQDGTNGRKYLRKDIMSSQIWFVATTHRIQC